MLGNYNIAKIILRKHLVYANKERKFTVKVYNIYCDRFCDKFCYTP
jgi:hypothetical protein